MSRSRIVVQLAAVVLLGGLLWVALRNAAFDGDGSPSPSAERAAQSGRRETSAATEPREAPPAGDDGATVGAATTRVRVLDESDHEIAGAALHVCGADLLAAAGTTDAFGVAVLPWDQLERGTSLVVSVDGFRTREVALPSPRLEALDVVLVRAARRTGRVVDAQGAPGPEGMLVLAWDAAGLSDGTSEAMRALAGDPRADWAYTDASGSFVLARLAPERSHYLSAGGRGMAVLLDSGPHAPDSAPVELVAQFVFAAQLRLLQPDGEPVQLTTAQRSALRRTILPPRGFSPLLTSLPGAILAEVQQRATGLSGEVMLAAFQAPKQDPAAQGCALDLSIPGFERLRTTFSASWIEEGAALHELALTPTSPGNAALTVRFAGAAGPPDALFLPQGALVLVDEQGQRSQVGLGDDPEAVVELELPVGRYSVRFVERGGTFQSPSAAEAALALDLTEAGAELSVALPSLGAIRISTIDDDAGEEAGFAVTLSRGVPELTTTEFVVKGRTFPAGSRIEKGVEDYRFRGRSGVIRGLAPGTYCVEPGGEFRGAHVAPGDCVVEVRANEVTEIRLRRG